MAFTYNSALSTDRDWIRADLGDTDPATAVLADEQIAAVLADETTRPDGNRTTATWRLAAMAMAAIALEPVKLLDAAGSTQDFSERLEALRPLAEAWQALSLERAERQQAALSTTQPTPRTGLIRAGSGYKVR